MWYRIITLCYVLLTCAGSLVAQVKIGDNPNSVSGSAVLEVESVSMGFLPPRMTTAQRNAIPAPVFGLQIYNTDSNCMEYYRPSGWYSMCPKLPTLSTNAITSITGVSASSGGDISDDGGSTVTARGICWSTNPLPTLADFYTTDGLGIGSFTSSLTSLLNGTPYYVRAYATNSVGTAYGNVLSFTTLQKPTLTTTTATFVLGKNATSGGEITSDGGTSVTARGLCWSTNQNPTLGDNTISAGTGSGSFSQILGGLSYSTTYYVRAYATNSVGTSYGNQITLSTSTGTLVSFTTAGTSSWSVPQGVSAVEVLIVAGGGGGGAFGGGGGGGGVIYKGSHTLSQTSSVSVTVGNGGAGSGGNAPGANGGNSVFDALIAFGGGGGGTRGPDLQGTPGSNGGCGGGGSPSDLGVLGAGGDSDYIFPKQGYDGGSEINYGWGGSGGGGAGGVGIGGNANVGGNGGSGFSSSITGILEYFAGGGGGCSYSGNPVGQGGVGGGGAGVNSGNGNHGVNNKGGGGGGSGFAGVGGNGGSGVVYVRY
jgi:hypothetical protein